MPSSYTVAEVYGNRAPPKQDTLSDPSANLWQPTRPITLKFEYSLRSEANSRGDFRLDFKMLVPENLVFLRFREVLEVIGRSGKLVGRISPNFSQKRSEGFFSMTKQTKKFTTIKFTTIKVWAYRETYSPCPYLKESLRNSWGRILRTN